MERSVKTPGGLHRPETSPTTPPWVVCLHSRTIAPVNAREIAEMRMHNQHLRGTPLAAPEAVVGWLGAMQAQEFPVAKWSVAQRARGVDNEAMDRSVAAGTVLRTHILRPTWHFVLPTDIHWMLEVSAPRVNALNAYYYRKLGLDEKALARSNGLLRRALEGGVHLTRKDMAAVLDRAGVSAEGLRLGYILMRAELAGVICSGAPKGKQQTYALLDERAPKPDARDREEGVAELTRRFFSSRGPATLKDFLAWSSLTAAEGRAGLDAASTELDHEVIDGRTYWFADSSAKPRESLGRIDLLQGYDEYIMSYKESRDVMWEGSSPPTSQTSNFTHAIVLDGRLVGHWRRAPKMTEALIESSWYRAPDEDEMKSFDAAIGRFGRFLGVPAAPT